MKKTFQEVTDYLGKAKFFEISRKSEKLYIEIVRLEYRNRETDSDQLKRLKKEHGELEEKIERLEKGLRFATGWEMDEWQKERDSNFKRTLFDISLKRVAKSLLRVARRLLSSSYGHSLWIDPKGKVIDMGNDWMHYSWITRNFHTLFPGEEFSKEKVFDLPFENGWIHFRNHPGDVSMTGKREAIRRNKDLIGKIIMDNFEDRGKYLGKFFVVVYFSKTQREIYELPKDFDELRSIVAV
jgi:hypothetical protein